MKLVQFTKHLTTILSGIGVILGKGLMALFLLFTLTLLIAVLVPAEVLLVFFDVLSIVSMVWLLVIVIAIIYFKWEDFKKEKKL